MRKLLVAFSSLLATLVLMEIVTRVFMEPPQYVWRYTFDEELGFRAFVPDGPLPYRDEHGAFFHHWNSRGYRGREYSERLDEGAETILFVGDSFVQGYGVRDERMPHAVVERAFLDANRSARCFTASGDGYGTVQELMLLRRVRPQLRPSQVVLMLYTGNDVINNAPSLAGRTNSSPGDYVRPYLDADGGITYLHPWRAALRARSRLFGRVEQHLFHNGFLKATNDYGKDLVDVRIELGLLPEEHLSLFDPEPDERWLAARRATEAALTLVRAEVEADGAQLLVAIVPNVLQVQRVAHFAFLESRMAALGGRRLEDLIDFDAPENWLSDFCESNDIEYLACLQPLRALVEETGRSAYHADGHLNGRGQEYVGAAIARRLLGQQDPELEPIARPVDLLERTLAADVIDFTQDPHEETVLPGALPAQVMLEGEPLLATRMQRDRTEFATPGREGLLAIAGVTHGAGSGQRFLRLDGFPHRLPAPGAFWITQRQVANERPFVRAIFRGEADLWLTGFAVARTDALLSDEARVCFERLMRLTPVEHEAFAEALRTRGGAMLEDDYESELGRLRDFWGLHEELAALRALATGELSLRASALAMELRACVAPLIRKLWDELDDALFTTWALALGESDLLAEAERRLSAEPCPLLARVRDQIALSHGARQRYGTIGVETADGWFGPPAVAPAELARNRAELGLDPR